MASTLLFLFIQKRFLCVDAVVKGKIGLDHCMVEFKYQLYLLYGKEKRTHYTHEHT